MLIPTRDTYDDGGSVVYKAAAYEVTKLHRLHGAESETYPYIDGWEVKIFNKTVYYSTNEN